MIQRIGNCSNCGYFDGFMGSWFDPEKEVIEARWLLEIDPELLSILLDFDYITVEHADGDWVYHLAKRGKKRLSVYRWPISIDKVGFGRKEKP